MQPWNISVTHCCVNWGEAWEADIRRALAAVGWTVTSLGPTGSSTHVEEDHLEIASASKELSPTVLMDVLSQLGVHQVEYIDRDGDTFTTRSWSAVIDEHWWGRCTDPRALVAAVPRSAPDGSPTFKTYEGRRRKFWLCACAASRFCAQRFKGRAGPVFDVLERFADGKADGDELRAARDTHLANDPADPWPLTDPDWPYPYPFDDTPGYPGWAFWEDAESFGCAVVCEAFDELRQVPIRTSAAAPHFTPTDPDAFERLAAAARAALLPLVRDVLGNPYRPVKPEASWLAWNDGTVVKMAQAIYDDGRFDRMPLLADALEESGCAEPGILAHCRAAAPHVRGCWVIDFILSKDRSNSSL
jgi:hypothetical protein